MITFVGSVAYDQVPRYLADADVGLAPFSPSLFSALELGWFWSPIKVFEYLAAGLPVATIDIPEMRGLLPETVARFYPPEDPGALATTLERLASDRAALRDSQRAARALAESRYTWGHQAVLVEGVLRKVVNGRAS
jgi:glycosyltransferase involved in cell wall biosynthesis